MRLLILTQKVDKEDSILGFFHGWIEEFSKRFESIIVICLEEGVHTLPSNVKVFSLGKEKGYSKVHYIFRFWSLIFKHRNDYNGVFVHMNPEYVVLGGMFWRMWKKKIFLWYNHEKSGFMIRATISGAHKVLHTSPYAYPAKSKKSKLMPAGIDTDLFKKGIASRELNSLLSLGRISPIKNLNVLIESCKILAKENVPFHLSIYGNALSRDTDYYTKLKVEAGELERAGKVVFHPGVANFKTPEIYNKHEIFINLSPDGLFDKTILEAMATETPVLVSSSAFKDLLPEPCRFKAGQSDDLALRLKTLLSLPSAEKLEIGQSLRNTVSRFHSLSHLGSKLRDLYENM